MSDDRAPAFVDTNVLVYAFNKSDSPKKRSARRLLDELMADDRLRVSTQILQELFVTLTRKVKRSCSLEEALAVLDDLAAWPLVTVDYAAIRAAAGLASQAKLSFWDALVVVAAARSGATELYTEDLNDGQEILGARSAIRSTGTRAADERGVTNFAGLVTMESCPPNTPARDPQSRTAPNRLSPSAPALSHRMAASAACLRIPENIPDSHLAR